MLEAVKFLHEHNIVHGKLTCESIYINSNNGEIKIGDVGIKYIFASENDAGLELGQSRWFLKEQNTKAFDVFCFGLALLETISTKISSEFEFKYHNKIMNLGRKQDLLNAILDD